MSGAVKPAGRAQRLRAFALIYCGSAAAFAVAAGALDLVLRALR